MLDAHGHPGAAPVRLLSPGFLLHPLALPPLASNTLARRIERACLDTIAEGRYLTRDLGGKSGTSDFTRAIIGRLDD